MLSVTPSIRQQPRLVLCPYGIPHHHRGVCTSILLHCGGDVNRLIDAPTGEQPFLRHLSRLSSMLDAVRSPIVLLTTVLPLMARVVLLRERYETELPALRRADWLLFLDRDVPVFVAEALRRGRLVRDSSTAIWHGPAGMRFLVVSPESDDGLELERGMATLAGSTAALAGNPEPSRTRVATRRKLLRLSLVSSNPPKR